MSTRDVNTHGSGDPEPGSYIPLPRSLAEPRETARAVFDQVAYDYDRARPSYPDEAITDLCDRCRLTDTSRVLEVGCGTGQATRLLARVGCAIRCFEPGDNLARLARANLASSQRVEVLSATFEAASEA
ncbi:MAG: class I SAM-dependent methyltransferase [Acidimicrobiales bacterium]